MSETEPLTAAEAVVAAHASPPPEPAPAKRISELPLKLCHFESDLPKLSPLLQLCPNNPTYRSLLSQRVRKIPPTELTTYEQLKDWVESNYDPCSGQNTPSVAAQRAVPVEVGMDRPVRQVPDLFDVEMDLSDTAYGRCHYSTRRSGSNIASYSVVDIARIIEEEDCESLDGLLDIMIENAESHAWDDVDMESGDYDYSDYDMSDTENGSVELTLSRAELRQRLNHFLQRFATRDQLDRLGLDTPF